ncbi:hypothetical protein WN51_00148 [Melipona quadrifasciata]|uniref:Uncharacterized protein n=1 Tax=Melipona quadrifasciata TaxID=166423 RepID=A0A0M9ABS4_9HYME|nr:hypothetical protein WN51_00148 [Melipona quadrifasciata]
MTGPKKSTVFERAQSFNVGPKFPTTPCLDVDFNEFCINIDQEHRESRGSVSYTDYYSNEDGQIRNCGFGAEQRKQDVKQIFEQKENLSTKSSSSYKKIGRFLVESMEISDEDVRIKETDNVDKTRSSSLQKTESFNAERMQKNKDGTEIAQEQKKLHSSSIYIHKMY